MASWRSSSNLLTPLLLLIGSVDYFDIEEVYVLMLMHCFAIIFWDLLMAFGGK